MRMLVSGNRGRAGTATGLPRERRGWPGRISAAGCRRRQVGRQRPIGARDWRPGGATSQNPTAFDASGCGRATGRRLNKTRQRLTRGGAVVRWDGSVGPREEVRRAGCGQGGAISQDPTAFDASRCGRQVGRRSSARGRRCAGRGADRAGRVHKTRQRLTRAGAMAGCGRSVDCERELHRAITRDGVMQRAARVPRCRSLPGPRCPGATLLLICPSPIPMEIPEGWSRT